MKRRMLAKIGLLAASIIVSLVLLELLSAYFYEHLPRRFNNGKRIVEIYMGRQPGVPANIEPHPYLLYQNTRNYRALGFQQHNAHRYRNREFDIEKVNVSTRIVALGGSTTYMFPFIRNPDKTWVARLEAMLKESIDKNAQVINAGQNYATTAELLAAYVFRHQYLKPDILVIHVGGNDVAPLLFENYDPEYTHFRAHGSGLVPRRFESALLSKSRFFRLLYAIWLNSQETAYRSQPYSFALVDREKALDRVRGNDSQGFRRNLDTLIRLAKNDGVKVILFGFVQAREQFLSRNRPEFKGLERAMVIGVEKHYRVMEQVSEKYEIPFIVPAQELFDDSWFMDNAHLNEQGEEVKAKVLFRYLKSHKSEYFRQDNR